MEKVLAIVQSARKAKLSFVFYFSGNITNLCPSRPLRSTYGTNNSDTTLIATFRSVDDTFKDQNTEWHSPSCDFQRYKNTYESYVQNMTSPTVS